MNSKTPHTSERHQQENDELRSAVRELNESIAYLSKMVLQLQRSMVGKNNRDEQPTHKPEIIH
jgi:predicted RNase H-like nuclease (RuvC/YqgF family)